MYYITVKDIEELNIDHIYLDFDEVCVNSIDSVLIQLNRRFNTSYVMDNVKTWNFKYCFPTIKSIEIEEIFDSQEFFDNLTWKDGVIDFITRNFNKITIVSKGNSMNLYRKEIWINQTFRNIDFIGLEGTDADKSDVYMGKSTMHIDDNQENLWSTDAEYKVLFENVKDADWNDMWGDTFGKKRDKMKGWL